MKKFQFVKVDLYNHFFSKPEVVQAENVVDACVAYYEDAELAEEMRETFTKQLQKNDHEFPGLATNTEEGTWRISGEEDIILITEIAE